MNTKQQVESLLLAAFLSKEQIAERLALDLEFVERVEQEMDIPLADTE